MKSLSAFILSFCIGAPFSVLCRQQVVEPRKESRAGLESVEEQREAVDRSRERNSQSAGPVMTPPSSDTDPSVPGDGPYPAVEPDVDTPISGTGLFPSVPDAEQSADGDESGESITAEEAVVETIRLAFRRENQESGYAASRTHPPVGDVAELSVFVSIPESGTAGWETTGRFRLNPLAGFSLSLMQLWNTGPVSLVRINTIFRAGLAKSLFLHPDFLLDFDAGFRIIGPNGGLDCLLRLRMTPANALICECWTGAGLLGSRYLGDAGGSVSVRIKGLILGASYRILHWRGINRGVFMIGFGFD